ncbi:hypothetical protein J7I94_03330 [Streptomyces sp. ISL-12]|uniref:hypothetical protein n=1 Tax=Streptomyces sp. ISL-12 TaxID=2819177 RepID=UPI001BE520AB|nr:hypothetical protein [Streptomyces sp. ISL-12]MBT2409596.1 hypothetical protein [Streptomyces sp. ISL-12]
MCDPRSDTLGALGLPAELLTARISERLLTGARLAAVGILAAVHLGLALPALLSLLHGYRRPWLQLCAFGLLTLVLLVLMVSAAREWSRRHTGSGRLAAAGTGRARPAASVWPVAGVACAVIGSAVATADLPDRYVLSTWHWSFQTTGWFGVVLLMDRPLRTTWAFLSGHLLLMLAQLSLNDLPTRQQGAAMAVVVVAVCGFQITVALGIRLLSDRAESAGAALREQQRLRTEAAVAGHLHQDQRARYRALGSTVFPLLTGLADGSLDPRDDGVRRRCALEAARLRRLLAEHDYAADPLVHELRAGIDVAERNGVGVQLAVRGAPVELPRELRRALIEPVLAVLTAAHGTARATVVRGGGRVSVGVVVDGSAAPVTPAHSDEVRVRAVSGEGRLWVESVCSAPAPAVIGAQSSSRETSPS